MGAGAVSRGGTLTRSMAVAWMLRGAWRRGGELRKKKKKRKTNRKKKKKEYFGKFIENPDLICKIKKYGLL